MKALVFWMLIIVAAGCSQPSDETVSSRPNIIFIMPDDQAVRTVSAYEGAINHTPNIDRLADEGVMFMSSFVANSICNPARASILTGKHSHKHGVVGNASPWDNTQPTLPGLLQQEGYTTALIGKWHLNNAPGGEFDHSDRLTGAGKQGFYYNPEFVTGDGDTTNMLQGYSTDLVTDKALEWVENHTSTQENPFLMFVHFKAPHVPRMPAFRFLDRYAEETIPEPQTLYDDYETRQPYAAEANMGFNFRPLPSFEDHDPSENIYYDRMTEEELREWHRFKDPETDRFHELDASGELEGDAFRAFSYQMFIKDYLRMIDAVDENVGRLLNWLDEHPEISENTIVVYTSDQGYFTGEHGWAEKRFMYEESIHAPLMIRWPGHIEAGSRITQMVQNIDFAPSLLDMAGAGIPDEMQGRSFRVLLDGDSPGNWRNAIYYHYYDHGIHNVPRHDGIRTDRYKLIHFYTDDAWEFYDLENDPNEINNLYADESYAERIEELKMELQNLREQYDVPEHHFSEPYVRSGIHQQL